MDDEIWLKSAVVNHNLIYESQTKGIDINDAAPVAGEQISYLIIQRAAAPIDGEAANEGLLPYSMMANIRGNGVFWADPYDSMANNIFRQTGYVDPEPGVLSGVNPARHANTDLILSGGNPASQIANTLKQVKKEESGGGFWSSVGNGLMSAASTILPMLLDPEE